MYRFFYPDGFAPSVYKIRYDELKTDGINNLLFDIDNTLAPVRARKPTPELVALFDGLKASGFNICLLSNGKAPRVREFAGELNVPFIAKARKPALRGMKSALGMLSAEYSKTAIIGDQIFTDILCGKITKTRAVLVEPITKTEQWYIKIKRFLEKFILNEYKRKK